MACYDFDSYLARMNVRFKCSNVAGIVNRMAQSRLPIGVRRLEVGKRQFVLEPVTQNGIRNLD
jgi:hypothetical protein